MPSTKVKKARRETFGLGRQDGSPVPAPTSTAVAPVTIPIGPAGEDGEPGIDGLNGATGPIGPAGPAGQSVSSLPGQDGEDGLDGWPGAPGRDGTIGTNGSTGPAGVSGAACLDGDAPEEPFMIPGPQGPAGTNGTAGAAGAAGAPGLSADADASDEPPVPRILPPELLQLAPRFGLMPGVQNLDDLDTFQAQYRRWGHAEAMTSGTSPVSVMMGSETASGTVSVFVGTRNQWLDYLTGAVAGNSAGSRWLSLFLVDFDPTISIKILTGTSVTGVRIFFGMGTFAPANLDTQTNAGNCWTGFRFSDAAGDTGFMPFTWNKTTQVNGSQLGTVAVSTEYILTIRVVTASNTIFYSVASPGAKTFYGSLALPAAFLNQGISFLFDSNLLIYTTGAATRSIRWTGRSWSAGII